MFAIAFDLVVAEALKSHPKGVAQAYADIGQTLGQFGLERVQGSLYVTKNEDMANLFVAMNALRALPWFPVTVRDIRAFRMEQWSDFTTVMNSPPHLPRRKNSDNLIKDNLYAGKKSGAASAFSHSQRADSSRLYTCSSCHGWHRA